KPLAELSTLIQNQVSRGFLHQLLMSGAVSFVTFVGWEAGSQLWKEALFQIEDADVEPASKLRMTGLLGQLLTLRWGNEDVRLFGKIMWKAFEIATFQKPHLSKDWVYNTWRLRLATG